MNFHEKLNEYTEALQCTAKQLSEVSGLSAATLSRYRSGARIPELDSEAFRQLCAGIAQVAADCSLPGAAAPVSAQAVAESFLQCPDLIATDKAQFRRKLNTLISALNMNLTRLCQNTNYEISALYRIRSGSRNPSDPVRFASDVAGYVAREMTAPCERETLAKLLDCSVRELSAPAACAEKVMSWLIAGQSRPVDDVTRFLKTLDSFDLNQYIKAIHFDELKLPPALPLRLPVSKDYFGLANMMESELDFLKATVLSRSMEPVIMYSDMPMGEMAKDPQFPKKWMYGMAMMLKKGLHLHQIHNLDRSFEDMMLGLESWIPMYMTGQVSPYYLKGVHNSVFLHFLKVSGTAALSGEAIADCHSDGKYHLTTAKDEVAYYRKRAQALLAHAQPLMEIYRVEDGKALNAFLLSDSAVPGKRRNLLFAPPLYTMDETYLAQYLTGRVPEKDLCEILAFAARQRQAQEALLAHAPVEDDVCLLSREEFDRYPMSLSLSGMFYETDIPYTYEAYQAHLQQTRRYAQAHPGYILTESASHAFRNLEIHMHEGKWAMVSKANSPAIHFVIYHSRLRSAIEAFIPPVTEP